MNLTIKKRKPRRQSLDYRRGTTRGQQPYYPIREGLLSIYRFILVSFLRMFPLKNLEIQTGLAYLSALIVLQTKGWLFFSSFPKVLR